MKFLANFMCKFIQHASRNASGNPKDRPYDHKTLPKYVKCMQTKSQKVWYPYLHS